MRIKCPECGARAVIKSTNPIHPQLTEAYCACSDVNCGHTYVLQVSFKHTLSPSRKSLDDLLVGLISSLGIKQKAELLDRLNNPTQLHS
ncbi:ogr/Delta-like zinc finger family protein [Escherichia coli]|uniref:ogr/Delta-like zinc finger family protein n=1 Tax=Citrobacter freundii complex TaxID=1344959 RepID=UPI0003FE7D82|nr:MULTISPECIES: ogr/Delta-like zinc finger family protein [Citrobacter freundii complex]EJK5914058.1 ogr/Delta-like zinc finger family protein [Escherichia coli]EKX5204211.1 ogr/Delta-like zinc finger family protein [Citrobacter freundii]MCJ8533291.1 ogr/Delta-like zinc finger family protein [Citrobacter freundii]WNI86528.1 ogr/Delta-like zinc finger family protein [Citrobacter portucalensis]HBG9400098.1 ogr/Delta-like zinc finger family protein [Citrobacter freundii]